MKVKSIVIAVSLVFSVSVFASGGGGHAASEESPAEVNGSHVDRAPHWEYLGSGGPNRWGELAAEFSTCKFGRNQSPINIEHENESGLFDLEFHYSAVPLQILNNGHTIQFNYGTPKRGEENFVSIAGKTYPLPSSIDHNSTLSISGEEYKLLQVHFHSPSEHEVYGEHAPMEAHFVHMNNAKQLAVVGVMLVEGETNELVSKLWSYMPASKSEASEISGVHVNASSLLPRNRDYYHYRGSLTTPPCSEGVRWFVMKDPVEVSRSQVKKFLSVVHENARPVQSLNNRFLLSSH